MLLINYLFGLYLEAQPAVLRLMSGCTLFLYVLTPDSAHLCEEAMFWSAFKLPVHAPWKTFPLLCLSAGSERRERVPGPRGRKRWRGEWKSWTRANKCSSYPTVRDGTVTMRGRIFKGMKTSSHVCLIWEPFFPESLLSEEAIKRCPQCCLCTMLSSFAVRCSYFIKRSAPMLVCAN